MGKKTKMASMGEMCVGDNLPKQQIYVQVYKYSNLLAVPSHILRLLLSK